MTTPTSFNTVGRVVQEAYEDTGLVAVGSSPNSEQWAAGMNKLNTLVNYFQTKGLKLFTLADVPLTLQANTPTYAIGPAQAGISMVKPLRVLWGYFLDANQNKIPMTPLSWQELTTLQTLTTTGQPVNYFVDKQVTKLAVTLWPTPDTTAATGVVHLVFQNQISGAVSLTDQIAFPVEWFLPLKWGLADEICAGQPDAIVARCAAKAERYRMDAENFDVEDAQTFFSPDIRGGWHGNSFT